MLERHAVLGVVLAVALGVSVSPRAAPSHADLARLLPAPDSLGGWRIADGPTEYRSNTLWEYLDGGAPRYLSYGFRRLIHARYQLGDDPLSSVTLDVFDMGDELGAFGIYRAGLPTEALFREWGSEGYRSGTVAAAWRNNVYVHAVADDQRPALVAMLEDIVTGVCDSVVGDPPLLAILDPLPSEARVPRSERYVAVDLLGHAALPGGVFAAYETEDGKGRLFFSDLGTERAADEALGKLHAHYEEGGALGRGIPSVGAGGFRFTDPTLQEGTVVRVGRFVAGVHGGLSWKVQEELLARLVENLDALACSE
jgi:hypothetical protein